MSNHIVKRGAVVVVLSIILSLIGIGVAHAFGVSAQYLENNTFLVYPGHNYTYTITLQNGDDKEYNAVISYHSTKSVAQVDDDRVYVPAKNYSVKASFNISIPTDAKIGEIYVLEYNVTAKIYENWTEITVFNIPRGLNIIVIENPKENIQSKETPGITGYLSSDEFRKIYTKMGEYALILLVLTGTVFVVLRIWKMSKKMSSKIERQEPQNTTISDAKDMEQVKNLLKRISDDEFSVPEIRNIFRKKIAELTKREDLIDDNITRKELIRKIR